MSNGSSTPLFSRDLHEIGTRLVDLLNQTGFLYRFPGVAGVTLACIAQHFDTLERLLAGCESRREALGESQSRDGYTVGGVNRPDPLMAAFDYACRGYRAFVDHLKAVASARSMPEADRAAITAICEARPAAAPQDFLSRRELIETMSEQAASEAAREFQVISEQDWQGLRIVLFFFLLELEKTALSEPRP